MIGAIFGAVGRGFAAAGKGAMNLGKSAAKGLSKLGKGVGNILRSVKADVDDRIAARDARKDAKRSKDHEKLIKQDISKFDEAILEENQIPERETSTTEDLSKAFHLTDSEKKFLEGLDDEEEYVDRNLLESTNDDEDPSKINTVDDAEFDEVIEEEEDYIDSSDKLDNVSKINKPDYKTPIEITEENGRSVLKIPNDKSLVSDIAKNNNRNLILNELEKTNSDEDPIKVNNQVAPLKALKIINSKLNDDKYLFMQQQMKGKAIFYHLVKRSHENSRILRILAKYLVTKDGEIALTSEKVGETLSKMTEVQDSMDVVKASELSTEQDIAELEEHTTKTGFSIKELASNISGKVKGLWQGLMNIPDYLGRKLDKMNEVSANIMDFLLIVMMGITYIPKLFKAAFGDLSAGTILDAVTTALKKWSINLLDLLGYWWKTVSIPGLKKSEGEIIWNGGDFYFKYNGNDKRHEKGEIERTVWADDGTQLTQRYKSDGSLYSVSVTSGDEHAGYTVGKIDNDKLHVKESSDKKEVELITTKSTSDKDLDLTIDRKLQLYPNGKGYAKYNRDTKEVTIKPYYFRFGVHPFTKEDIDEPLVFKLDKEGNPILAKDIKDPTVKDWWENYASQKHPSLKNALMYVVENLFEAGEAGKVTQEKINEIGGGNAVVNENGLFKFDDANKGSLYDKHSLSRSSDQSSSDSTSGTQPAAGSIGGWTKKDDEHYSGMDFNQTNPSYRTNKDFLGSILGTTPYKITSEFNVQRPGHKHGGIDIGIPSGTTLNSPIHGKVLSIGHASDGNASGNRIWLMTPRGVKYGFFHLSRFNPGLSVGDYVQPGNCIGYSGNSGRSTGPHLHLEVHVPVKDEKTGKIKYVKVNPREMHYISGKFYPVNNNGIGDGGPEKSLPPLQNRPHVDYRGRQLNPCERGNNPGNIRNNKYTEKFPGFSGITHTKKSGNFCEFSNMMYGIHAFFRLINENYIPRGYNTIHKILYKYCPPGDHGQGAPTGYIKSVCKATGLGENQVIPSVTKDLMYTLMKAVYAYEGGRPAQALQQADLDEAWAMFYPQFRSGKWVNTNGKVSLTKYSNEGANFNPSYSSTSNSGSSSTSSPRIDFEKYRVKVSGAKKKSFDEELWDAIQSDSRPAPEKAPNKPSVLDQFMLNSTSDINVSPSSIPSISTTPIEDVTSTLLADSSDNDSKVETVSDNQSPNINPIIINRTPVTINQPTTPDFYIKPSEFLNINNNQA